MPAPDSQGEREHLVAAGLRLLATSARAIELQPDAVCAEAGQPRAAFERCFVRADDYLLALFQHLLDEARAAATQAATQQPGILGLKYGIEAYLDSHLRYPAVRELTLALRNTEAGQAIIARRVAGFHRVLQVGLSSLHSLHPLAGAQLLTALVAETTQTEYENRAPVPEMREAVYAYLDRLVP